MSTQQEKFMTAKGKVVYQSIYRENVYKGQGTGKYVLKIAFDEKETKRLQALIKTALKGMKSPRYTGFKKDESGQVTFTFKSNVTSKDGEPRVINVFDAKKRLVKHPLPIGKGSEMKVSFVIFTTDEGASLYMNQLQLLKLEKYSGSCDFEEEDGWDGSDEEETDEEFDAEGFLSDAEGSEEY